MLRLVLWGGLVCFSVYICFNIVLGVIVMLENEAVGMVSHSGSKCDIV